MTPGRFRRSSALERSSWPQAPESHRREPRPLHAHEIERTGVRYRPNLDGMRLGVVSRFRITRARRSSDDRTDRPRILAPTCARGHAPRGTPSESHVGGHFAAPDQAVLAPAGLQEPRRRSARDQRRVTGACVGSTEVAPAIELSSRREGVHARRTRGAVLAVLPPVVPHVAERVAHLPRARDHLAVVAVREHASPPTPLLLADPVMRPVDALRGGDRRCS